MKLLCIEDGSVLETDLKKLTEKQEIDFLVYRQGSNQPYLIDNRDDLKDLHQEIIEKSIHDFDCGKLYYKIEATKLREIFEKRA